LEVLVTRDPLDLLRAAAIALETDADLLPRSFELREARLALARECADASDLSDIAFPRDRAREDEAAVRAAPIEIDGIPF
jgi:hypothetical protein